MVVTKHGWIRRGSNFKINTDRFPKRAPSEGVSFWEEGGGGEGSRACTPVILDFYSLVHWTSELQNVFLTLLPTLFQHCNVVLRKKSPLRIVPCNITLNPSRSIFQIFLELKSRTHCTQVYKEKKKIVVLCSRTP